jgi:DNA-binding NarL/FixJ family response regulator
MTEAPPLPRIVIADDHPSVLDAFCRMLQRGCEIVATAPDGDAAVEAVTRLRPDVLIVDLMMPDINGLEVCRLVKLAAPKTAVIIVTAFDDADVEAVALQNGAAAYVAKQAAASTLQQTIQRIMRESRTL